MMHPEVIVSPVIDHAIDPADPPGIEIGTVTEIETETEKGETGIVTAIEVVGVIAGRTYSL
jgi:hypothetical protein